MVALLTYVNTVGSYVPTYIACQSGVTTYLYDRVFSPNDNNANKTNIIKFSTQKVYNNTRKP